jgi:outer membrane protein OmpA-like peptidoglycan-associated protein
MKSMRLFSSLPATLALVIATSVNAQQPSPAKTPSVEGYLCTFAHKCGDDAAAPVETIQAPRTKGFRLARAAAPAAADPAPGRASYVAPAATRHGRVRDYTISGGAARQAPRYAAATTTASAAGRPRADLMIGFELNSARISQVGLASARIFAQSLLTPELLGKRFVIEGHTDLRGGRALNMDLSQRRAQAVTDFLVSQGVDRSRLTTRGFGPDVPLPGHTASDPDNRRVEAELGS